MATMLKIQHSYHALLVTMCLVYANETRKQYATGIHFVSKHSTSSFNSILH